MTYLSKILILIFTATFCFTILMYYYNKMKHPTLIENSDQIIIENSDQNKTKYILYWPTFNYIWWSDKWGYKYEPFKNCMYNNCYATNMIDYMPEENFDAVIFHVSNNVKRDHIPFARSPHQVYILATMESPLFSAPWDLEWYESFFNWTMTYRFDSDIVNQYGYVFKEITNYSIPNTNFFRNKTGAAWFVSHCDTSSKREVLAKELQKLYKVDIYGKCGNLTCSMDNPYKCFDMLEKKYKFYLSFESAYCEDYVTEKLYDMLQLNVVPIVYGCASRNAALVPPGAVINVEDFTNVSHLADYLKYLDNNTDKYGEYFKWKVNYVVRSRHNIAACRLCKKLHQPIKKHMYEDINAWWFGIKNCKTGKELPKIVSDLIE